MAKLGFLGLEIMGRPMASHLLEAGHDVALSSYSAGKGQAAATARGVACATPVEVAERSDCVFVCVGDTEMSREVILGNKGLAEGASSRMTVVDYSTISPSVSRKIGDRLSERSIDFLDAPCTGSKKDADVLNNSAANAGLISAKAPLVFVRDFSPAFWVKWLEKDMQLMLESAAELNVPAPLTALSRQLYRAAIAKGFGAEDICGSIRVFEDITGCEVIARPKQVDSA